MSEIARKIDSLSHVASCVFESLAMVLVMTFPVPALLYASISLARSACVINASGCLRNTLNGFVCMMLMFVGGAGGNVIYAPGCIVNSYHCVGAGNGAPVLSSNVIPDTSKIHDPGGLKTILLICTSCTVPSCNVILVRNGCIRTLPRSS